MSTMEEACRSLLLHATITSIYFEKASRELTAQGVATLPQSLWDLSDDIDTCAIDLFNRMNVRGYGISVLPGMMIPEWISDYGWSYTAYRDLMSDQDVTSASSDLTQLVNRLLVYSTNLFQVAMDAAIRAAKDNNREMLQEIAGYRGILRLSAYVWLLVGDAIEGMVNHSLFFIPDSLDGPDSIVDLSILDEVGNSEFTQHMPPEFMFARLDPESGIAPGQQMTLASQSGHVTYSYSPEAGEYIKRVIERWHSRLRQANGIN